MSFSIILFLPNAASSKASSVPNQAGRINRICVQANTQGIARRFFISCDFLRLDGLEPIKSCSKTFLGVTVLKYHIKLESSIKYFR